MRKAWVQLVAGTALLGVGVAGGWAAGTADATHAPAAKAGTPGTPAIAGSTHHIADPGTAAFHGTLVSYDSCAGLLGALRTRGKAAVGPYGFGSQIGYPAYATLNGSASVPSAATGTEKAASVPSPGGTAASSASGGASDSALSHSTTNTQVVGVDEPDQVKTDGKLMVSLDGQRLQIVDVRTAKHVATLALPHPGSELLLAGDRVVVLSGGNGSTYSNGTASNGTTSATIVDIANPAAPTLGLSWNFDAGELAARVVNGTIRLVLSTPAPQETWSTPRDSTAAEINRATKANQAIVDALPLDAWLPHWTSDASPSSQRLTACDGVATPVSTGAGTAAGTAAGMVTVVSLDPKADRPGAGTSVFGAGDSVYAEGQHLFVSSTSISGDTNRVYYQNGAGSGGVMLPLRGIPSSNAASVQLLEFDLSNPAQARYLASGTVAGQLHDSYALSEYQNRLRVTTTTVDSKTGVTSTGISVLAQQADKLVQVGRLNGLGTGEQVYAVRYLGDRGYVVTFRQLDPLHVVDLSDPVHPTLRGTLTMPGYSSLLLPLDNHRLLGIGQSVQAEGNIPSCQAGTACPDVSSSAPFVVPNGLQLSLFDVTDSAHPKLLDRKVLTGDYASAVSDPHAVTLAPGGTLALLPSSGGLIGVTIGTANLTTTVAAPSTPTSAQGQRTVIAGSRVFELTDRGVAVRDLPSLKQTGWLTF